MYLHRATPLLASSRRANTIVNAKVTLGNLINSSQCSLNFKILLVMLANKQTVVKTVPKPKVTEVNIALNVHTLIFVN